MAGWPSAAQRHELGSFPVLAGPEDVKRFFDLAPDDLRWALSHRGDARLGAAVLLCSLRWLGFVPEALAELPQPALLALCEQLEADPDELVVYGARAQTRSDHLAAARARAGFRAFDHEQRVPFEEWLALRAMEHERPKALWELSCEHLLAAKVVRPLVDALVRMIAAARERAHTVTAQLLAAQLAGGLPRRLDRLLELREPGGVTWLEWLRTPAAGSSPAEILTALEKLEYLRLLDGERVDLSMLAPGRVRMLAAEGRRRAAWEISRLPPTRRHPLLLVFVQQMFVERGDELIDRYCTAIQNVERTATQAVKDQREATARERDERSQLAGLLSQILLDAIDNGDDPVARARAEIGEQRLRACVEDREALASPIDVQRRDAKHRRHAHLARFAPAVLAGLDPRAARGYEPLLEAIRYSAARRGPPVIMEQERTLRPVAEPA